MDASAPTDAAPLNAHNGPTDRLVTCHEPRPGRFVFIEQDNVDGWIATDDSVELTR